MKSTFWLVLIVTFLTGCVSQSINLNYYLLHSPQSAITADKQPRFQISLQKLALPEYLKQRSLVMQTSATTLHFSPHHVWAEPVQSGMIKALEHALWQHHHVLSVPVTLATHNEVLPHAEIAIAVDDFLPVSNGEAILSGKYWIQFPDKSKKMYIFNLRRNLNQDGFDHAVIQMQELINALGDHIAARLNLS
ncbi:PqiC family protein [Alteromonas sp. ASW11-130]|uniref:PqiC family protein n=1 Tax=Alteromonas sp. ASW11-130 TaxID=3015775 RepID=UPI0022425BAC|nr:ABC-type transport auxiliary lipoprotein family protein [Alteromonas sp. ASW11-130]MCW8091354.1 PqiC family protein [Alteromonas sp. ASW11-130]